MKAETIWPYLQCLAGSGNSDALKKIASEDATGDEITADCRGNVIHQCGSRPRTTTCKSVWRSNERHAYKYGERAVVRTKIIALTYKQHWYGNTEVKRAMGYILRSRTKITT